MRSADRGRCGRHHRVRTLGEASTLSLDEKLEVLDITVEASRGRVPVLLSIAENSTLDGCRQADHGL